MVDCFPWGNKSLWCVLMMQACDRADLVTCSCSWQEKPARDLPQLPYMWFGDHKEGFLKTPNVFWYPLTKSVVNVFYCLPLSASASLCLSIKIDIWASSSLYIWWNHQLFCRIVFNLQLTEEAQCFGRKRFFLPWKDLSLCSQHCSSAALIAAGKASDIRGWQFIICLGGTSICLQPWERWAYLID